MRCPAINNKATCRNGDGLDDLIVGAYFTNSSAGKSYVVFGKADSSATPWIGITSTHNQIIQAITIDITCTGD
jgi:hypothetical protein